MRKFFVIVLSIAVVTIAAYGIKYALTPVNTQKVEYITHETSINTNGFVILDEWVITSRSTAVAYYSVSEGERVAKDSIIGELFYGEVSEESMNTLASVDRRLKAARAQDADSVGTEFDAASVENNIYRRENDIIDAAYDNDIHSITRYKKDINSLRSSNRFSTEDTTAELEAQRSSIINNIGVMKEDISAEKSGIFTTYIDGFENSLILGDLWLYDVPYFEALPQKQKTEKTSDKVDAGGVVCKIVNNHVFYVVMCIPSEIMEGHKENDSVTLRLNNMASALAPGYIYAIGADSGGRRLVTVRCPEYVENAFSQRVVDVDLIFESYTGYKIPVHAIRTDDNGKHKVIGIHDGKQYDCYVDILYVNTDGGYMIAQSTADSVNKLSQMDRMVVGER